MKIAYFLYWLDSPESGVIKKVADQTSSWRMMGHDVHVFISTKKNSRLSNERNNLLELLTNNCSVYDHHTYVDWYINSYEIYKAIKKFSPDLIYLRNSKYSPGLVKILKAFPSIMELNGNEWLQMKKFSPGYIYTFLSWSVIMKPLDAFVSVSYELMQYSKFSKLKKPYKVIGNGINQSKYKVIPVTENKQSIDLVFIGTAYQPWHGIDEILRFSQIKTEWKFHIIGNEANEYEGLNDQYVNVRFYGVMKEEEYLEIFKKCDVAIGTMALYRKKINETSALKVIEYLSCGLPVIIGYTDTNFIQKVPFILELPNRQNNMVDNLKAIEDFVLSWKVKRVDRELVKHIDVSVKEKERLVFFEKIISQSNKRKRQFD